MLVTTPETLDMIVGFEVTSKAVYIRNYSRPTWPQGQSGVTIAVGYDLGYESIDQIREDWKDYLSEDVVTRLCGASGIQGSAAQAWCRTLSDIEISWEDAEAVFRDKNMPRYSLMTQNAFPNCDLLPDNAFGALESLVYNRGGGMNDAVDDAMHRRLEMRNIRAFMINKEFDRVPAEIRSMKRLWNNGLVERREVEATAYENAFN